MKFDPPSAASDPGLSRQQRRGAVRRELKSVTRSYKRMKWTPPVKQAPADVINKLAETPRVLDREHHDPTKQVPLRTLVVRIIVLAQVMLEKRYYAYQVSLAKRVVESILEHDGEVVTALFSRQSGKTETIGGLSGALAVILPQLAKMYPDDWRLNITDSQGNYRGFAKGFSIGIYAPKQEQSAITFERARRAVETKSGKRVLKELKIDFEENNGNTLAFTNGSRLLCQSASKQSEIEGATHHLLVAEEAQDLDDLKVRKSLHPMVASTMGSIVKIGTASTFKCDFYNAIQNNRREELLNPGKRNHFYFPWTVCAKYNSLYAKYIEGEKKRLGEHSDEFRMAYMVEWIFERGMFVTHDVLFSPEVSQVAGLWSIFYDRGVAGIRSLGHYSVVAGIDWGKSSDSTVVTLMAVDWMNPLDSGTSTDSEGVHSFAFYRKHVIAMWEYTGDNYEYQFGEITSRLDQVRNLRKIVMDSNSCGSPIYDRFSAVYGTRGIEVVPFNFQPKVKSDGYKAFSSDLWAGRITIPAGPTVRGTMEFRKFATQTLDLKKEWKNGVMQVSHPDERGAHDDFPDSVMLAAWGCNIPAIGGRVELSNNNPFYSLTQ